MYLHFYSLPVPHPALGRRLRPAWAAWRWWSRACCSRCGWSRWRACPAPPASCGSWTETSGTGPTWRRRTWTCGRSEEIFGHGIHQLWRSDAPVTKVRVAGLKGLDWQDQLVIIKVKVRIASDLRPGQRWLVTASVIIFWLVLTNNSSNFLKWKRYR